MPFLRQILGADSKSALTFYIRGQYQADIGHFLQFCLRKSHTVLLNNRLLWQQLKSQINKTYIFGCSLAGGGGGGGGVSESMDRRGCAILALKLVLKNFIFT